MTNLDVKVTKLTYGRDGYVHLTIKHPLSRNYPTLIFKIQDINKSGELRKIIEELRIFRK